MKKIKLFLLLVMLMSITGVQKANAAKEIYAALSGSTMTIYYDDQKASRSGVLDKWSAEDGTYYLPGRNTQLDYKSRNQSFYEGCPSDKHL